MFRRMLKAGLTVSRSLQRLLRPPTILSRAFLAGWHLVSLMMVFPALHGGVYTTGIRDNAVRLDAPNPGKGSGNSVVERYLLLRPGQLLVFEQSQFPVKWVRLPVGGGSTFHRQ